MAKEAKRRQPGADRILSAALVLAEENRWRNISMEMIAEACSAELITVYKYFPTKADIIGSLIDRINQDLLARHNFLDKDEPARERLLDVLMQRFELLTSKKKAVCSICLDTVMDPSAIPRVLPPFTKAMTWCLEAAGINASGFIGLLRVKGLSLIYLSAIRVWIKDDTEDLSVTLAHLDRNLRKVEGLLVRSRGSQRQS